MFDHIDAETSRAIAELADMPKLLEHVEKEKQSGQEGSEGGYSMCVALAEIMKSEIRQWKEESMAAGRAETRSEDIRGIIIKNFSLHSSEAEKYRAI